MIELQKFEMEDIPYVLEQNIDRWDCNMAFGGKYPLTEQYLLRWMGEIDIHTHIYKLIVDGNWVGFFAIWQNRSEPHFSNDEYVTISNTLVFENYRNKAYQGKPYMYWIAIESAKKAKELFNKKVWGMMYDVEGAPEKHVTTKNIPTKALNNRGLSSVLDAGWVIHNHKPTGTDNHIGNVWILKKDTL